MLKTIVDYDTVYLEWSEVQQHWHISPRKQEYDKEWAIIAGRIDSRVIGAFCDWVEETKIGFSDNRRKRASLKQMREYWEEFYLIIEILIDRGLLK